jgi:hypothetical protein
MDDREIYEIGVFCEGFLTDSRFPLLTAEFEYKTVQQILATKPEETAERERLYALIQGTKDLFGFMAQAMEAKRSMTPNQTTIAEEPSTEPSDDDVFDIYRPLNADELEDCT